MGDPRVEAGRACYAAGDYFAAHEAWEEAWRAAQTPHERALYQSLVQLAAALHKLRTRPPNALAILARACARLATVPEEALRTRGLAGLPGRMADARERLRRALDAGSETDVGALAAPALFDDEVPG